MIKIYINWQETDITHTHIIGSIYNHIIIITSYFSHHITSHAFSSCNCLLRSLILAMLAFSRARVCTIWTLMSGVCDCVVCWSHYCYSYALLPPRLAYWSRRARDFEIKYRSFYRCFRHPNVICILAMVERQNNVNLIAMELASTGSKHRHWRLNCSWLSTSITSTCTNSALFTAI